MAKLSRSWRAFRALSWAQRRLLAQAWLLLPLTAVGLRLFGYRRVQTVLNPAPAAAAGREDLPAAQAVARIVQAAAGWSLVQASCLARSLVLCRLLRGQGLAGNLRIGVAVPDGPNGRLAAHAWVEHQGVALNDSQDVERRFAAFDRALLSEGTNAP
jgi:hypothetical protein